MRRSLVRDVMNTDVVTVPAATPFMRLVEVVRHNRVGAIVVVDHAGCPHGIVTPADLIVKETDPHGQGGPGPGSYHDRERRKATAATAGELMSAPPVTAFPHTTVAEAAQVMRRHAIAQLPVIESATGRLVGLISMSDALNAYLRRDDDIQEEISREIIRGEFVTDAASVTVRTLAGVVTLDGRVRRRGAVPRLVHAVQEVEGVVRVEEHLGCPADDLFPVPPLAW
jgi:CBS domain-containing protein